MKQIAVIFEGNMNQRMGVFNAVINRVKHLQRVADYKIDVHMVQVYDGWLMRRLRHSEKTDWRPDDINVDGVKVHITWFRRRWCDVIAHRLFHSRPRIFMRRLHRLGWEMRGHDLVSAHDRIAGHVAAFASKHLHIPCFITWHGSSIHTQPQQDSMVKDMTIELLQSATCNFFVSQGLLDKARKELTPDFPAQVLLNGADSGFVSYSEEQRATLRKHYGIEEGIPVVTFAGRFEPVKNVLLLPDILQEMQRKGCKPLQFIAIGDGPQLEQTRQAIERIGVKSRFLGNVPHSEMPDLLNCTDLLVLPSRLEGLPLIAIEALDCGARVVASNVGGTAEAVGRENAIDPGEGFVERFAARAVQLLQGDIEQTVPENMTWTATADLENSIYRKYLDTRAETQS